MIKKGVYGHPFFDQKTARRSFQFKRNTISLQPEKHRPCTAISNPNA